MSQRDRESRIADNPSAKAMSALMPLVKAVKVITGAMKGHGLKNETVDQIHQCATDVLRQSEVLDLPDRFNDAFADQGWIATQSFGMEAMRRAIDLHRVGNLEGAEQEILAWFNYDNINLFAVNGSKRFDATGQRWYQLREALRLTFEERYWSAVPLILIACDGLASDVLGTSPFEKDADLTVFDSLAGHPTSVPALIASLTKGVRKTSSAEMTMPLRHGILHGRSLGYANKVVCMKAWLLMVALVDWACDKTTENERISEHRSSQEMGWGEIAEKRRRTQAASQAIDAYRPRTNTGPFDDQLDAELPESAILKFLSCWQARNYGHMARLAVNLVSKPVSKLAGDLRASGEQAHLTRFEIRVVRQTTVALAEADVYMEGVVPKGRVKGLFRVRAHRNSDDGEMAMPTEPGRWYVQQSCMVDLREGRTIGGDDAS